MPTSKNNVRFLIGNHIDHRATNLIVDDPPSPLNGSLKDALRTKRKGAEASSIVVHDLL